MGAPTEKMPTWLELEAVIPLSSTQPGVTSVESLTSLSYDTIIREYSHLVIKISPRRRGMKLRNALKIASGMAVENAESPGEG